MFIRTNAIIPRIQDVMDKLALVFIIPALEIVSFFFLPLFVGPMGTATTVGIFALAWWGVGFSFVKAVAVALATCYVVVVIKHRTAACAYIMDIFNMLVGCSKGVHSFRDLLKADRAEKKTERKRLCDQRRRAMRILFGLPLGK